MLSRLYYMLRLSPPEEEALHPLDCQALQPPSVTTNLHPLANHTKSGLNLPPQQDPPTSLLVVMDKLTEISHNIVSRIDSLTAEVEQLREATAAQRRKRRRQGKMQSSAELGDVAIAGENLPQLQKPVKQQVQPHLPQASSCKQPEEVKGRRCGICREPGHNALTCQATTPTSGRPEDGSTSC